jgi:hypothetical protein
MATNKRDLKSYVRYDGSGRVIPGSNVLRKNMPKVGKWKQTQGYECCEDILPSNCIQFVVDTRDGSLTFFADIISSIEEYTYTVTWGDGTTGEGSSGEGTVNLEHTYSSERTYTVRVCFSNAAVITELDFPGND